MVETITPVVHGGRKRRWALSVVLHVAGAALAAAAFGAALGGAGAVLGAPWGRAGLALAALVAAAYAGRELLGLPIPLLERRRQVPEWWRTFFGPHAAAFLYGLGLGIGFLTFLRYGTLIAVGAMALASGDPAVAALLLLPFGLARGLAPGIVGRARTSRDVAGVVDALEAFAISRGPRIANGLALLAVAGAGAVAAAGAAGEDGRLAGAVLALAFAWAAATKVFRPAEWGETLAAHRLGRFEAGARVLVPLAEVGVVVLAVADGAAAGGLAAALLVAFSAATLRARRWGGDRVPCGCFGRRQAGDYRLLLARNGALLGVAAVALWRGGGALPVALRAPSAGEVLPAILVALGATVGAWAVARSLTWMRRARRA